MLSASANADSRPSCTSPISEKHSLDDISPCARPLPQSARAKNGHNNDNNADNNNNGNNNNNDTDENDDNHLPR